LALAVVVLAAAAVAWVASCLRIRATSVSPRLARSPYVSVTVATFSWTRVWTFSTWARASVRSPETRVFTVVTVCSRSALGSNSKPLTFFCTSATRFCTSF
jgi:hypothetical protein